jgi:hypothetical protein
MTQQVQTILCLTGVANGSSFNSQQPTVLFEDLPYSVWATLPTPRTAKGKVVGFADPSQYSIVLLAVESRGTYTGNAAWVADIAADGTFQMQVDQAAPLYIALLMTPAFAASYISQTFPGGSGTTDRVPTPADNPGDVLLMLEMPAGLNRSIVFPGLSVPELAPGQDWVNTEGYVSVRSLQPLNTNQGPDPNNLTPQTTLQLWQMMYFGSPATMCVNVIAKNPDGSNTAGALSAGVYVYGQTMYLIAGAGPTGGSSNEPVIVTSPLVQWQAFAPSNVQLNMNLTILPEKVMLSMDVMEVDPSLIYTFLKALIKVEKKLMELMFADI